VAFVDGHAAVTIKLQSVGLRTLTVQVNGIAAPQSISWDWGRQGRTVFTWPSGFGRKWTMDGRRQK
jgi:hypothetical protein